MAERLHLLGAGSNRGPAKRSWWSLQEHMFKQVFANAANGVHADVFNKVFAQWDDSMPPADEEAAAGQQDAADYRKFLRSKAWRSKIYMSNLAQQHLTAAVLLCAEPLDHMAMRLQHESVNGSILLALLHDRTNPVRQAQSVYYDLLCTESRGAPACDILLVLEYMYGQLR
eukprot:7804591-Karenia_brevis.AAC.1